MEKTTDNDSKAWSFYQSQMRNHLKQGYPRQRMLMRKIKRLVPKGASILEIGYGDGYLLHLLDRNGYLVTGSDISEQNMELTRKQRPKDKFSLVTTPSNGRFTFPDSSFDGFVASEVLEHMSNEQIQTLLTEIKRVVKPDGIIFLTFPAFEDFSENMCFCPECGNTFHKRGHKQYWDLNSVRKTFSEFQIYSLQQFIVPYEGNSWYTKIIGRILRGVRTLLLQINLIKYKSFLLLLKNRK